MKFPMLSLVTSASAAAAILLTGCADRATSSDVKIDSAHSIALDAVIPNGILLTKATSAAARTAEVKSQLYYTMGQLNGEDGVADLARLEVSLGEATVLDDGSGLTKVAYAAKVLVAWDRTKPVPETYQLYMPARGDYEGLEAFFAAYQEECLDYGAHDVTSGIFWYYYRPQNCNIATVTDAKVAKLAMNLVVSGENTEGKSPEYTKVWEDGKLVVTAIFGKYEAGATEAGDAGIAAYDQMYRTLRQTYGEPVEMSVTLAANASPGVANPDIRMVWSRPEGTLDVEILLVDEIKSVDDDFRAAYNKRTEISDYVSYSGHSGLGANIRAMAKMGHFLPGQYQLFLVNGCDTFAYVDNALRDAHAAANPDAVSKSKYFDIITNAMPSYFHMNTKANMAVIKALLGKTKTYRQLLAGFDPDQKAVVTGEHDNAFPAPF